MSKPHIFLTTLSRLSLIVGIYFLVYETVYSTIASFIFGLYLSVCFFGLAIGLEIDANTIKRDVEEAKRIKLRQRQVNRLKQDVEEKETMKMREA